MVSTEVTVWLLLLFALPLLHSKCLASTCKEIDCPNLDPAMVGFDPFLANAYEQFDPGFKHTIFEPTGRVFASKFNTYSFPNEFNNYFTCALQFTSTVLTNFSGYQIEKENRFCTTQVANDDKNCALNEVNINDVSTGDLEEDTKEKIIREFFLETDGEMVRRKFTFIAQELTVPSFPKPALTADFSAALQTLQLAAKESDPEYSKKLYREFVDIYGTHYMKKSKMGAEIIFQKLFTKKEMDDWKKQERQDCIKSKAQKIIEYDAISVKNLISDISELFQLCDDNNGSEEYLYNCCTDTSRIIINGPPLTATMKEWITAVKRSPVPISFVLENISHLFLRNSIESSLTTDDRTVLCKARSRILLYNLFERMYSNYCEAMGGKHCSPKIVSFGANSGCPQGTTCNKVSATSDEYKCATPPYDIGGVIVTGGRGGSTLSDVETINMRQLPDLPTAVRSNTISQVGTQLYTCGGHTGSKTIDYCYTLDLSSRPPLWESSSRLPKPLYGHSAVTIGSHIWFTYDNQLYDFNTEEQLFRTLSLPMVASLHHCAVSNNTHSYIIGAGVDKREIWVNKHSSRPEEWLLVARLGSGRDRQGCLWFGDNVFIAGGFMGTSWTRAVQLFNTETNTVTSTGQLLHARYDLQMMVLNGEPAVVGGGDGSRYLNTVQTWKVNSKTWQANGRKLVTARGFFSLVQLR